MFNSFFLSAGCLIFLFLSIHILFAKKSRPFVVGLLFIYLFSRFCQIFTYYLVETGHVIDFTFILQLPLPIYYAAPACGFLYLKALLQNKNKLSPIEYLHFIPAALSLIEVYYWFFSPGINLDQLVLELVRSKNIGKLEISGFMPSSFHFVFKNILLLFYLTLSWKALFQSKLMNIKGWANSTKTWVFGALSVVSLQHLNLFIRSLGHKGFFSTIEYNVLYQLSLGFSFIILFGFFYFILLKPGIIYNYLILGIKWNSENIRHKIVKLNKLGNLISKDSEKDLVLLLDNLMIKDKLFLMPKLDLTIIAQVSSLPIHKCSGAINSSYGICVPDWINKFRIDYFIQSYSEKYREKTIEAIAIESGFGSKATFYRAFKKEKGVMPSDYFSVSYPLANPTLQS
jgi:AraC-like DNA-binding protein